MKKYYLFIILIFFMLGIISSNANNPLQGKTFVIDAGHGGLDPGTTYKDIYEKDINLKISLYLKEELQKRKAKVIMIRSDDYDLSYPNAMYRKRSDFDNRIKIINESNADFYLSIHLNYLNNPKYKGMQVFSTKNDIDNANVMQKYINKEFNFDKPNKIIDNSKYMYKKIKIPGLLIECGFLSNSEDRSKLITDSYQRKIALIIANGLIKMNI